MNPDYFQIDQFAFFFVVSSLPTTAIIINIESPLQIYFQSLPNIPAEAKIKPQSDIVTIGTETKRYFTKGIFRRPRI